ncbi:hypothetical protein HT102_04660 [Hoyosella sp. G463]|uniref:Proline rich protein n=1 Tax=Lolliginicoccus lacisalsi TaxID=2742202 RepID=A0A927PK97_9ACTN|nr:hypothetical protein [Lolliginicoccus lacisalsi]MBD8505775.1 hypothetical protein [Lolliginicoccus lacisalsi]
MTQYPPPPPGSNPWGNEPQDNDPQDNDPQDKNPQGAGPQGDNPYGGYPPPPPMGDGGTGYPPPPPMGAQGYGYDPQGGYPAGGAGGFDVMEAGRWAWSRFADNAPVWLGFVAILAVLQIVSFVSSLGQDQGSISASILSFLISIAGTVIGWMMLRGALLTADGRKPAFGEFAQLNNVLHLVLASILVGIMVVLGLILLIIPGLVIAFLTMFTVHSVLDHDMDVISAIKNSFKLVSANVGPALLLVVAFIVLGVLTLITCGLGAFVTIPLGTMMSAYAFRTFSGRQPVQ